MIDFRLAPVSPVMAVKPGRIHSKSWIRKGLDSQQTQHRRSRLRADSREMKPAHAPQPLTFNPLTFLTFLEPAFRICVRDSL